MMIGIDMDDVIRDNIEAMLPYVCWEYNLNYAEEKRKGSKYFDNPYELCKRYLSKYNIKYDKLIVDAHDKGSICKRENIDVFIDDSIKNCVSVGEYGIRVFIYDNTYNKNEDRFDRVYNWKEIYDKIKNQH